MAIGGGLRLYQLRDVAVSPNAPERSRAATDVDNIFLSCDLVTLQLSTASPSPSPSPSTSPSASPSSSPSSSPTASPVSSPTQSPTSAPSTSPAPSSTSSPTSTSTSIAQATPVATTTTSQLPAAGVGAPTILGMLLAAILLAGALILAL